MKTALKDRQQFIKTAAKIRDEMQKLDRLYAEWQDIDPDLKANSLILRGKASIFSDFYSGAERIFRRIADTINGGMPKGESWQQELLNDMKLDMPELRPAVISEKTYKLLLNFIAFRHKFRNIGLLNFDFEEMKKIEIKFPEAHTKFKADLEAFLIFVDKLANTPPPKV
jgi:hypothetical protein